MKNNIYEAYEFGKNVIEEYKKNGKDVPINIAVRFLEVVEEIIKNEQK